MLDPEDEPEPLVAGVPEGAELVLEVAELVLEVAERVLEVVPGRGHAKQASGLEHMCAAPPLPPVPPPPPHAMLAISGAVGSVTTAARRILVVRCLRKERVRSIPQPYRSQ